MNTKTYEFKKSITSWDEGIPVGDGKLGTIIYGDGPIRASVDRIDLWDNRTNEQTLEEGFNYKHLIELVRSGREEDWKEHGRLFDRLSKLTPYPSKITAGRLEFDFGLTTDKVNSFLDMRSATAKITLPDGRGMTVFNSAVRHIGVFKIFGEYKLNIHIPLYISGDEFGRCALNTGLDETADNWCLQYPRASVVTDGEYTYYHQKTHTDYNYTLCVMEKPKGDFTELYYTIVTSSDTDDVVGLAKAQLSSAYETGYDKLHREHIAWWKKYNAKSSLIIPDKEMEKAYNASNYHFASCSREGFYPMALQGVWTADNDSLPPWKGDYHFDTNVQISYQHYLRANRMSEGKVICDYLWDMRDEYKKYTKEFFGVDGYLLPSTSTILGKPIGGWAMYCYAPSMTIWMVQCFDEYYLYSGDEKFLRTRLYPVFREVGKAIYALMEEKDGKLYLPLSSSPEIFDNQREAYLEPNSNCDLSLLIYLYTKLRDYSEKLGKDKTMYEEILSKLDPIAIDPDGIVMLDKNQLLPFSHRHFSHTMCIYPLHLISYDTEENKRIIDATLLHLERLGAGWWSGFSFGFAAQLYAICGRGNAAYLRLWEFVRFFLGDNGFHLNGDFKNYGICQWHIRPFTLESQFSFCDALQEMLLQEHEGYINLLPAIPMDWNKLEYKKLRSYGGLLVSLKYSDGNITSLEFSAPGDMTLKIKDKMGLSALMGIEAVDGFITLQIKRGKMKFPPVSGV